MMNRLPACLAPLLLSVFAAGCAAGTVDDPNEGSPEGAASAVGAVAAYDAVIRNGTKVDTRATPTATQSASTHLIGFIPHVTAGAGTKQLLTVGRWADIRDTDGTQPFTQAQIVSDSGTGAARKIVVKLTLDGGVDLDVKAVATQVDDVVTVKFINTTSYSHWFAGMILQPEKLVMEVKLVPYHDGVIVDATTRVKLEQMEDRAPKLTASITAIFGWLKKNTH